MSRTGVGCRVLIDGALLDDGCINWGSTDPDTDYVGEGVSAESGLNITWGRETTVDQPESSSCSFTVVDDIGGKTVLQTLNVGQRVEVYADATISGGTGTNTTFEDPGFESAVRAIPKNATVTRVTDPVDTGTYAVKISPTDPTKQQITIFPPGIIQAENTNPAAWVTLQTTNPGETWSLSARVFVPAGLTVKIRPVLFSGPYASAAVADSTAVGTVSKFDQWTTVNVTFYPAAVARWVGFQIETTGGAQWDTIGDVLTWATIDAGLSWEYSETVYVDSVSIVGPGAGSKSTVNVFSGRITDLEGFFDESWGRPAMNVTASDMRADLGNRYIGDEPFPLETASARIARILALATLPGDSPFAIDIAPALADINISWDDVDNAAADGLLLDVAKSVDGVLWSASHPAIGPYMRLEDPAARIPLYELNLSAANYIVVRAIDFTGVEDAPPALSACDILRDPVEFLLSVADVSTRVTVTWLEQLSGDTAEHSIQIIDTVAERDYGTRAVSLSSMLTTEADAIAVANQIQERLGAAWRISGLVFADADVTIPDAAAARSLMLLLNAVTRGGQALLLTDLDTWSPVGASSPIYLEGGSYAYIDGGWELSLNVSRALGIGYSAQWDELGTTANWIWDRWDPGLTWDDLRGAAGPQ